MLHQEYKRMMDQLSPREELVDQVLAQARCWPRPAARTREKGGDLCTRKNYFWLWRPPWW